MRVRRQSGQVLVVMLALWAVFVGGLLLVFNVGQTVAAKLRLVNAVDAAAYSAATWQARSLNLQAYMNRAMVANEVAIAQFVSLRSWSTYVQRLADNGATGLSWVPYLNVALRSLQRAWIPVDRTIQSGLPPMESLASHWNVDILMQAQRATNAQALPSAVDLARRVLKENQPQAMLDGAAATLAARNAAQWRSLTRDFGRQGNGRARLASVVADSRDGFTRQRNWSARLLLVEARRRGGTDLIGYETWRGMDTLGLHVRHLFGSSELPIAWGAAENRHRVQARRGLHGGSWRDNPRTSRLANGQALVRSAYLGLPGYRGIAQPGGMRTPTVRFVVSASLPAQAVNASDQVLANPRLSAPDGEELPVEPTYAGGALHALGAAEVRFRRPAGRADGRVEYANLFNPYWQVRLVKPLAVERSIAAAGGGLQDPYLVTR